MTVAGISVQPSNTVIPDRAQRVIRDLVGRQDSFNKIPAQGRDDGDWLCRDMVRQRHLGLRAAQNISRSFS